MKKRRKVEDCSPIKFFSTSLVTRFQVLVALYSFSCHFFPPLCHHKESCYLMIYQGHFRPTHRQILYRIFQYWSKKGSKGARFCIKTFLMFLKMVESFQGLCYTTPLIRAQCKIQCRTIGRILLSFVKTEQTCSCDRQRQCTFRQCN